MRFFTTLPMLAILLAVISGCKSIPPVAEAPQAPDPESRDLERLMDAYYAEGLFNGIVLVARDGEVIFAKPYGYANEEWDAPVDRDTKFRLASLTKQFTAMMILQLAEEGKLSLDDTIADHLPWYREDIGNRITIHHLLTHSSGLPNYSTFSGFFSDGPSRMHHRMRPFVEEYCARDLEFEPGERYSYCNSGYYVLGAIISEIEGKPWEDVVDERIVQRGHMFDTGAYRHTRLMPKRAEGYSRDSDNRLQPTGYQDMTIWRAAGSMYSTANDMLRWDQNLRNNTMLGEAWKNKMFTRQQGDYGYGVNVFTEENADGETIRYMGHSGSYSGFNNYFAHFPDTGEAIILLNNGGRTEITAIRDGIVNILLGNPYDLPLPTFALRSADTEPRLAINKITSRGMIGANDATFRPANAAAGTTIYATKFLVHDGEQVYHANSTGGEAHIEDGVVRSTQNSVSNEGMIYTNTPWLTSDLVTTITGTEEPRLELAWTFHNSSSQPRSIRMMWFTDTDLTTEGSDATLDRLAFLPSPQDSSGRSLLVFNHPAGDAMPTNTSGLLFHVDGAPHHFLGIAEQAGASGYWSGTGPFEEISPRAAGYQIPEELRDTLQNDANGDGLTDTPRDVGVSVQTNIDLPAGGSTTVRYIVDFRQAVEF